MIDVLKDILSASATQETTRIGDVSSSVRDASSVSLFSTFAFAGGKPRRKQNHHVSMLRFQAVATKQKYADALKLLRSLPGTDTSLEEQEAAIGDAKDELKSIR